MANSRTLSVFPWASKKREAESSTQVQHQQLLVICTFHCSMSQISHERCLDLYWFEAGRAQNVIQCPDVTMLISPQIHRVTRVLTMLRCPCSMWGLQHHSLPMRALQGCRQNNISEGGWISGVPLNLSIVSHILGYFNMNRFILGVWTRETPLNTSIEYLQQVEHGPSLHLSGYNVQT